MEAELRPDKTLDGTPVYKDIEKAELYGELFFNCSGSHPHDIDGETFFMACKSHQELMKKRKKKTKRKKAKYTKAQTNNRLKKQFYCLKGNKTQNLIYIKKKSL